MKNDAAIYVASSNYQLLLALLLARRDVREGKAVADIVVPATRISKLRALPEAARRVNDEIPWARFDAELSDEFSHALHFLRRIPSGFMRKIMMRSEIIKNHARKCSPNVCEAFTRRRLIVPLNEIGRYALMLAPAATAEGLEDGNANYFTTIHRGGFFRRLKLCAYGQEWRTEFHPQITLIHATRPSDLHITVRQERRVRGISITEALAELDKTESEGLVRTLLADNLPEVGKNAALILTQPLRQSGISRAVRVRLYIRLAQTMFAPGCTIYIKPHPADDIDWRRAVTGSGITVLPKEFPLEILELACSAQFENGLALCSTALTNATCVRRKIQIFERIDDLNRKNIMRLLRDDTRIKNG